MAYKSFSEMADTLRAGYAAGMRCAITLEPESAKVLADILDEHRFRLMAELVTAFTEATKDKTDE